MSRNLQAVETNYQARPATARANLASRFATTQRTDQSIGEDRANILRAQTMRNLFPGRHPKDLSQKDMVQVASATLLAKHFQQTASSNTRLSNAQIDTLASNTDSIMALYRQLTQAQIKKNKQLQYDMAKAYQTTGIDPNSPAGILMALQQGGDNMVIDAYDASIADLIEAEHNRLAESVSASDTDTAHQTETESSQPTPQQNENEEQDTDQHEEESSDDHAVETISHEFKEMDTSMASIEAHLEGGSIKEAMKIAEKAIEQIAKQLPTLSRGTH